MKNDYDAPEGEAFDEIYQSDGLRWMSVLVVLLVVFGFFSLAWYAYRTNTRQAMQEGEIMVVEGDASPYREKPANPGGMEFPHQDKEVYNRLVAKDEQARPGSVERLLPPPEAPMARSEISEPDNKEASSWIKGQAEPAEDDASDAVEASAAQQPSAQPDPKQEARQDTRKDEVKLQNDVPAYVPPKPVEKPWVPVEKTQETQEVAKETAKPETSPDPIVAQAEKFVQEKKPQQQPPVQPEPIKKVAPTTAPVSGGVEVQLAALRSRAEAETVWQKVSARHKDVLSGKSYRIVTAEIPGKGTFYRLRVSMGSAAAAKSVCSTLNQRNQACILAR